MQKAPSTVASAVSNPGLAAREAMIDSQLKPCGVTSPQTAAAFFAVPREDFVLPEMRGLAYAEMSQSLGHGREMMPPLSLGHMVEVARVTPDDHVLVVGAGTGYAAAILAETAHDVVALESEPELAAQARSSCVGWRNIQVVEGPLEAGHESAAPYSLILIDGAVEFVSQPLIDQLAEDGRLVTIFIGEDGVSRASIGRKAAGLFVLDPFAETSAALLPPFRKTRSFQF